MKTLTLSSAAAALAGAAFLALPAALPAQSGSRIAEIEVYGNDPCPRSTDDNIVVCARKPEAERYRIPEKMRGVGSYQSRQSWANKAMQFETVGRSGINSCSPVGPGGWTGCTQQLINEAFKENREDRKARSDY
jgi:hypothetical protein